MREFQEKRKIRKIMFSSLMLLGLVGLLVFLSSATVKVYFKKRVAVAKNEEMKQKVEEMRERVKEMKKENERLQSDFGREEEFRVKFNAQKRGEKVLIILDKKEESNNAEQKEETVGFFRRIWKMVKNIF